MPSDHDVDHCRSCYGRIRWAITVNGKRQAINADTDPAGNLAAHTDHTGTLKARALTAERPTLEHAEWQAMPHAATCTLPRPRTPRSSRPGRRAAVRPGTWRWTR
ncbi:hypothetical protein CF54_04140 [Streptomyces sp. Tu 6176]|uniref:hypothetical protein n=1 Tax=Streptomyces sp. Tu 6176 TaxID=1470557 RepID=UPI00045302FC|nr:hypothetical protein [Streptomyces sp. Tu 6176]EYT83991.1 hypothetical protein CF54_04140 [Streptomyces sp. Tu 6176]